MRSVKFPPLKQGFGSQSSMLISQSVPVVNVDLAVSSLESFLTGTSIAIHAICACSTIQTWIRITIINVRLG
jgi:hypothetical protein